MSKVAVHSLFDKYSQNLNVVRKSSLGFAMTPDVYDVFVCPSCFNRYFFKDDVDENRLSLEHIPPKKLGGQVRTLTCKACNNESGARLDSQLKKFLEFAEFWQNTGESSLDVQFSFNDSIFVQGALSKSSPSGLIIKAQPHRSDPQAIKNLKLHLVDAHNEWTAELRIPTYRQPFAYAAILRIAYLYAFSVLGYSFLNNSSLATIREQIHNPTQPVLPMWGIVRNDDFPEEALGLNVIVEPKELRSFFLVFDLITPLQTITRWGVMLPGPTEPGLNIYSWLTEHDGAQINQVCEPLQSNLDFTEAPFATYDIWNNWR